jgi:general L-amino acid transport system permease protein
VRVLRVALQVVFLVAVVALLRWLFTNLVDNLQAIGLRTDFGFLDQPAGFQILGSDFRASQTVSEALWVGFWNTVSVAVVGIILTTVLGVVVGVASLSSNWLVRKAATLYVEALRNLPPLIVIVFFFSAVILRLPRIQEATDWAGFAIISNKAIGITGLAFEGDGAAAFRLVLLSAFLVAVALWVWRTSVNARSGAPHHRVRWAGGALLGIGVVGWLALGRPLVLDRPEVVGVQVENGWVMNANYAALLIALVVYTASYIAEIVRGSIQAVAKGQGEAAGALGLSRWARLRFVVLPQAFRIAVPPLANQYLNLTKNSSLALVIGFFELTQTTFTVIGNGNPAPQSILILMAGYLFLSLVIAAITSLVNRRLQLVGR